MSLLLTLGAQAPRLALDTGANPMTLPFNWMQDSFTAYLQTLQPRSSFAALVAGMVPAVPSKNGLDVSALGDRVSSTPVVRMAQVCGAGADGQSCALHWVAQPLLMIGWVLLAVVLLARLARLAARGELRSPQHLVLDLGWRIAAGFTAMELASPVIEEAIRLVTTAALLLCSLFFSVVVRFEGTYLLPALLQSLDSLVWMWAVLYLTAGSLFILMAVTTIGLTLLSLLAPVLIPLALYGDHGKVTTAWFRALTTCLAILFVAPVGVALSLTIMVLFNNLPLVGVMSGAMAGEAGLVATSLACFVLAKQAFAQTRDGFRVTMEGVHLDGVGALPGQMVQEVRNGLAMGLVAGRGVANLAAGNPLGAADLGAALGGMLRPPSAAPPPGADPPGVAIRILPPGASGADEDSAAGSAPDGGAGSPAVVATPGAGSQAGITQSPDLYARYLAGEP